MSKIFHVDVVIIGGGIAGLWTLTRLKQLGYQVVLLESQTLGSGQTIASQGIIHGGVKYALKGLFNSSAKAVAAMPQLWQKCLLGQGEINLQSVEVLSDAQFLWSIAGFTAKASQFFASKALRGRVSRLKKDKYPKLFQNPAFDGFIYQLEECVLNVPSLINALSMPVMDSIIKIGEKELEFRFDEQKNISELYFHTQDNDLITLKADAFVLTAGQGMEALIKNIPAAPKMQRRPLQMVLLKWENQQSIYAHCMDGHTNPRVTITSHMTKRGQPVWYIGGRLAEEGCRRSQDEQIVLAQQEMKLLFPWLDFSHTEWASLCIDRAEQMQPNNQRPEGITVTASANIIFALPTKLALSPLLAAEVIQRLVDKGIVPKTRTDLAALNALPKPELATPLWDQLF